MADDQGVSEERLDWLWDEQEKLVYRVRLSAAYNGRRERFFNVWERLLQAFTALTATAAFSDLAGKDGTLAKWFALAAAVASILPLVLNLSGNAQRHGQLKSGFKSLLANIYAAGTELTEQQINEFRAKATELEAGEPAGMPAVVIACQNEIAANERKPIHRLNFWERCTMHFYPFDGARIVRRAEREKEELERAAAARNSAGSPAAPAA
jgi:hypothetical protein